MGLVYEDKVALRSRALVRIGDPMDLDAALEDLDRPAAGPNDTATVRRLTSDIERRLRAVAPAYADEREGAVLGLTAEIALREPDRLPPRQVPLSQREQLARRLAEAPTPDRERVIDAVSRYHLGLSLAGLDDAYLVADYRLRRLAWLLLSTALRLLLIAPIAAVGAVVNVLPYWAVYWAGRMVGSPAIRASVRLLTGVALFPATWVLAAWLLPWDAWWVTVLVLVVAPTSGLIAVRALEQAVTVHRTWRGWIALIERRGELDRLRADRAAVIDLIDRATDGARSRIGDAACA